MNIEDIKVGETYNVRVKVIEKYGDCVDAIYAEYDAIEGIHIPKRRIGILHPISTETAPKYDLLEKYSEACEYLEARGINPFNMQNGIKNADTSPKYDPTRKFRKGDKAKPRIINGRENQKMPLDVIFTVTGDEDEYGAVPVEYISPVRGLLTSTTVHAVWLELVTPVEELEPYFVQDFKGGYGVFHTRLQPEAEVCHYFNDMHPHAKEAAEAECARLNAEHRKEQNNG